MQFLKSLFCLQGFDNRSRFFAISSAIYIIFIMLSTAFSGSVFVSVLFLVVLSIVLALTSLRRLHDAKLNKNWLFVPSLTFALMAIVIIFSEQKSNDYLLIIPALFSAVLLTYPSNNNLKFIFGYNGPVDMKEYQQEIQLTKQVKFRIEPTLISENSDQVNSHAHSVIQTNIPNKSDIYREHQPNDKKADIGEIIRQKLLSDRKTQLLVTAIVGLVLIWLGATWLVDYFKTTNNNLPEEQIHRRMVNLEPTPSRNNPLTMPDNYTLYLSVHQGITINWQADAVKDTNLWSQLSAQGDESCKEISFNKGEPIRTLFVRVESDAGANINYFADFSPLDSKVLIQALAFRGNFTLCGYDFSLKGSQAALVSNKLYSQWIDY